MLNYIILGLLTTEPGLTGYELKKCINAGGSVFHRASYGSLYPALKKLEQQGFVTMHISSDSELNSRGQKAYVITEDGKDVFHNWLCSESEFNEQASSHLAKVYFFDRLEEEDRNRQLIAYEEANRLYLQKLLELEKVFKSRRSAKDNYYQYSTLYYGIASIRQIITWCQHIREKKPLEDFLAQGYHPE